MEYLKPKGRRVDRIEVDETIEAECVPGKRLSRFYYSKHQAVLICKRNFGIVVRNANWNYLTLQAVCVEDTGSTENVKGIRWRITNSMLWAIAELMVCCFVLYMIK